ncbi:hypothetical protein RDABS01_038606 [Bienertia sinuspersici]
MSPTNSTKKCSWLNKLKKAVKKINFLLTSTYKFSQWSLASISIFRAPSTRHRYTRHLSFNNESGIYHGCSEDSSMNEESRDINSKRCLSSFRSFRRMKNFGSNNNDHNIYGSEDIDRRADMFIENFYRQLRIERQVSLNLRYCSNDSSASSSGEQ